MKHTYLLGVFLLGCSVAMSCVAQQPMAAATATPVKVIDLRRMQPINGDAQAGAGKAAVCAACHGAQGVAIAAALHRELAVVEYAPKRVKQSITGNGNASKEQVAAMLLNILSLNTLPSSTDATDALAVAVCHYFSLGSVARPTRQSTSRGTSDWGSFIRNNPARVKK